MHKLTRPGWTISWWPFRLHCTWISFWKLSWEEKQKWILATCMENLINMLIEGGVDAWLLVGSHPLFHDVVGMIGHLFHCCKGSWADKKNVKSHILSGTMFSFHWCHQVSLKYKDVKKKCSVYLVCPCNRLSLQTGFSDSLKHNFKHLWVRVQQSHQTSENYYVYWVTRAQCCAVNSRNVIWNLNPG